MLQFPKSTHLTLPSVEQWGTNANILRDPPKSIFTRRVDKVGQNTDITDLVDASGDRAAEGISVYSRGVNPMVSVSYSNDSSNAGISGNPTSNSGRTQAFLPYPIMEGGAFRPPVRTPRDLLALSRMPRVWFSADASKSTVDYSKTQQQILDNRRAVKEASAMIHAYDVRPNKTADISPNLREHFKMLDKIKDHRINVSAEAGTGSRDITSYTRDNVDRKKATLDHALHAYADVNKGESRSHNLDNLAIDQSRYIQSVLQAQQTTNPSSAISHNLDQLAIDQSRYIQAVLQAQQTTNPSANINAKSAHELNDSNRRTTVKPEMIQYAKEAGVNTGITFLNEVARPVLDSRAVPQHATTTQHSDATRYHRVAHDKDLEFQRHTPLTHVTANVTKLDTFDVIGSRDARIHRPDLKRGEFMTKGIQPTFQRSDQIDLLASRQTDKDRLRHIIAAQRT